MPECHSTNSFALDRCQQLPPPSEGTIIITNNQYAGRGQRGNNWSAAPGENLTFSIILKPSFLPLHDQFLLNVCTALAVADFLVEAGCNMVSVKWPNDVYVGPKKICGILVESQLRGNQLIWSVVGIGLNINQQTFSISTATSLSLMTDRTHDLNGCLAKLVSSMEARYLQLRQDQFGREHKKSLVAEYESRLFWVNEQHEFDSIDRGKFVGTIQGIDPLGRLKILIDDDLATFGMKELTYLY